ncbi:MAG: hypothetical protein U9N82_02235, partial [Thermodesulfobacteriota bacterium]|nr:hypothetical protein [Thermodesulfobacteriota bacterium]
KALHELRVTAGNYNESLYTNNKNVYKLLRYGVQIKADDDPAKAPSKRLGALKNGYRNVAMGKTVSKAIGIQAIRR